MNAVAIPHQGQTVEGGPMAADTSARLTTTLYEVIATLQTVVEPDEDNLAVAVVVHWLCTKRLAAVGDATVAA